MTPEWSLRIYLAFRVEEKQLADRKDQGVVFWNRVSKENDAQGKNTGYLTMSCLDYAVLMITFR